MFSVIIPTLNEAANIRSCIRSVSPGDALVEIIVVDGGSEDNTCEIARQEGAIVRRTEPGRGIQFNHGAAVARGDILVFLHADTIVSTNMFDVLSEWFSDQRVEIGRCRLRFDVAHPLLQFYASCARMESVGTTFGDQCIALRRSFFDAIGGFPNWQLFEDVDLLQRARRKTRIFSFPTTVVTSARKFLQNGIVRQQVRNAWFLSLYLAGVSPDRLATMYNRKIRRRSAPASHEQDVFQQPQEKNNPLCEGSIV